MAKLKKTVIRSGLSGIVLPVANKLAFPEEFKTKSRLCYYSSLFNSIEINTSFYKVPMASTFRKWADEVQNDFAFTVKLSREVTHQKNLVYRDEDIKNFMAAANETGTKKGCLLIQFPGSITDEHVDKLDDILEKIAECQDKSPWRLAVEFRSHTWYHSYTYDLLDRHGAGVVLHDMPASGTTRLNKNAPIAYFRLHGPTGKYNGSYSEAQLREYADTIRSHQKDGKEVFVYFNNTMGDAVSNLQTLNKML